MRVLFLYLKAFSGIGGIEKFNRAFLKALQDISSEDSIKFRAFSLYDKEQDTRYITSQFFKGFGGDRINFAAGSVLEGLRSDLVILSHINLAPVGLVIKKLKRSTQVILVTYGIDVWYKLSKAKAKMLKNADKILSISGFTKKQLEEVHNVEPDKTVILPCTIDPYFKITSNFERPGFLVEKHSINESTKVILTVSRLFSTEVYKGYDKVIQALPQVIRRIPDTKYVIVGKGDKNEVDRLRELIAGLKLENYVTLTGYVPDEELPHYYMLSDVFIMPSRKEGFGIVFLEALACGKPVIAGNQDGSVDALLGGKLGVLVDPDNVEDIAEAVVNVLKKRVDANLVNFHYLTSRVTGEFGFLRFKARLREFISELHG